MIILYAKYAGRNQRTVLSNLVYLISLLLSYTIVVRGMIVKPCICYSIMIATQK